MTGLLQNGGAAAAVASWWRSYSPEGWTVANDDGDGEVVVDDAAAASDYYVCLDPAAFVAACIATTGRKGLVWISGDRLECHGHWSLPRRRRDWRERRDKTGCCPTVAKKYTRKIFSIDEKLWKTPLRNMREHDCQKNSYIFKYPLHGSPHHINLERVNLFLLLLTQIHYWTGTLKRATCSFIKFIYLVMKKNWFSSSQY